MFDLLKSELFWLASSFIFLLFFSFRAIKQSILKSIDNKIEVIQNDLQEAQNLKDEAYDDLLKTRDQYQDSLQHYQRMIAKAKEDAVAIIDTAKTKVLDIVDHSDKLIQEYEDQQRTKTIEAFRQDVIVTVLTIVETELMQKISSDDQTKIIEDNMKTLKKIWN